MKKLATAMLMFFVLAIVSASIATAADTIEYKGGSMGKVTFDHKKHQESIKDCKGCHHKDEAGKEAKCSTCHTKDSKVKAKDAYHNSCKKCHQEKKPELAKCNGCHKK